MGMATCRGMGVVLLGTLLAVPAASAQVGVTVDLDPRYKVETVFVGDFAPYNVGQNPDFLFITLVNGAAGEQTVVLELTVNQVAPKSIFIFRGRTDPFVLREPVRRLTNRDLASRGRDVSVTDYEIGSEAEQTAEQLAQTGVFPSGTYVFRVQVRTPQGTPLGDGEVRLDLVNPTRIELLAPGRLFGDPPPVVTTPTPRFVWSADAGIGSGGGRYRIRVVRVDAAASPEDAMQGFANWEEVTNATTALYPGSASAIALEPGTNYAWQVTREVRTSGGTRLLESPIYWFRMGGAAQAGGAAGSPADDAVAMQVNQLGQSLGLGNELAGFRPMGQLIVDGRPVAVEGLEELLRAILAGEIAVRSIIIR